LTRTGGRGPSPSPGVSTFLAPRIRAVGIRAWPGRKTRCLLLPRAH
jgi:hypothetical protein